MKLVSRMVSIRNNPCYITHMRGKDTFKIMLKILIEISDAFKVIFHPIIVFNLGISTYKGIPF